MTMALSAALSELATDVGRPALLEDTAHSVLAYSRHTDVTDHVREQTILSQRAPEPVRRWLARYDLHLADGPVRLPSNPQLHMLPRLCLPLRDDGRLFGFLWFIEGKDPLDESQVAAITARAPAFVDLLAGQQLSDRAQLTPVLRRIMTGAELDPADHEVCRSLGLGPTDPVRVMVAIGRHPHGQAWPAVLESLARHAGARTVFVLPDEAHPAVVTTALTRAVDPPALEPGTGVGLGDEVGSVAHLREAHGSAVDAATCAAVFQETHGFLDWSHAGLHRMVPVLARYQADATTLTGIASLLADPRTAPLAQTATVFLDLAGNVQATAAALHLHRTSLYYRLERFESLTGVDLREGTQRTAVHLALKIAAFHQATAPA